MEPLSLQLKHHNYHYHNLLRKRFSVALSLLVGPRASDVFLFGARVIETDVKNAERSEEASKQTYPIGTSSSKSIFWGPCKFRGCNQCTYRNVVIVSRMQFFLARSVTDANGTEDFWWRDNLKIRTGPIYHDLI